MLGLDVDALDGHELRRLGDRDDAIRAPQVSPELDPAAALVGVEELRVDEVLEVVGDDDVGKARLVERGRPERAEEHVGAEPLQGRAVGRGELQERLEEAVEAPPRPQDLARLLDVETGPEPVQDGALRDEGRDDALGRGLDEEVDLVGVGAVEEAPEEVEDEEARTAVSAVRRKGSEIDEDPQAPSL